MPTAPYPKISPPEKKSAKNVFSGVSFSTTDTKIKIKWGNSLKINH